MLDRGRVAFTGSIEEAVRSYLSRVKEETASEDLSSCQRTGSGEARITSVRVEDDSGNLVATARMGESINFVVRVVFNEEVRNPIFGVNIQTDTGIRVADCRSSHYEVKIGLAAGLIEYRVRIAEIGLYPRNYFLEPWVTDASVHITYDWVRNATEFTVTPGPQFLNGAIVTADHGIVFVPTSWRLSKPNGDSDA